MDTLREKHAAVLGMVTKLLGELRHDDPFQYSQKEICCGAQIFCVRFSSLGPCRLWRKRSRCRTPFCRPLAVYLTKLMYLCLISGDYLFSFLSCGDHFEIAINP